LPIVLMLIVVPWTVTRIIISGDSRFKFWHWNQLSRLRFLVIFLGSSSRTLTYWIMVGHDNFFPLLRF